MNRKLLIGGAAAVLVLLVATIGFVTVSRLRGAHEIAVPAMATAPDPAASKRDKAAAAIPGLQRATRERPADAAAWTKLGDAAMLAQSGQIAADAYRRAIAIGPATASLWSSLGEADLQFLHSDTSQMPSSAREAFNKALTIDPNDLRARFYLATEKDSEGHHDEAIQDWIMILAKVPRGSDADRGVRAAIAQSIQRNLDSLNQQIGAAVQGQPSGDRSAPDPVGAPH